MRDAETEMSSTSSATPCAQCGIPMVPNAGLQPAPPPPKLNGAGTRPPRLSRPSGRAERRAGPGPEAEGAPPPAPSVPQVRVAPRGRSVRARSSSSARTPGRWEREDERGSGAVAGRLGSRGAAAATARLGWNASPPASWKPLLALGLQPGLVPGAPAAATAGSALGRGSGYVAGQSGQQGQGKDAIPSHLRRLARAPRLLSRAPRRAACRHWLVQGAFRSLTKTHQQPLQSRDF